MIEIRLLGPVQVWAGERRIDAGPPRQRTVLAVLAAEAARPVSWETLADRVWGDAPPRTSRESLYAHVTRIRRVLDDAAEVGSASATIHSGSGGYLLDIDTDRVDVHRFRRLAAAARAPALTDEERAARWHEALELWRGEPLAGMAGDWAERTRDSWRRQHLDAVVSWAETQLRLGHAGAVLGPAGDLAGEHPYVESLAAVVLRALAATGRAADALTYYTAFRRRLVDELGAEPGAPLRAVHQAILAGEVAPVPAGAEAGARSTRPVPAQLPGDVGLFTGRSEELAALSAPLGAATRQGGTVVISAIGGAGGIGKTWLAVHWAHQHLDRFPDGQLFVNLRGFDPSGQPMTPTAAVRGFLDALGVPPRSVPVDLAAQVGLYRSLVAGRRMLIVLDNARDTAQIADLLPGSEGCVVLVTSRHRMAGLVRSHGAYPVQVDVLGEGPARALLARRLGARRLAAEPAAVARLVSACGGLPLALGIVAARAAVAPQVSLQLIADELGDAATRLAALDEDDPQTGLRAVLSWSYAALTPRQARVFALLGLAPGPDLGLPAAAALTGLPPDEVVTELRALQRQSLLHQPTPGRWRLHDLVRLYAAERAGLDLPDTDLSASLRRVVEFFLQTAHRADRLINPHRAPDVLDDVVADDISIPLPDEDTAWAWLDGEHPGLVEAQQLAVEHGWTDVVWRLARAVHTFYWRRGYLNDQLTGWQAGLRAAEQIGDPRVLSLAHRRIGQSHADVGRHREAARHLDEAVRWAERCSDVPAQVESHRIVSWALEKRGDDERALQHATRALQLCRSLDDPVQQAYALNAVGWYAARLNRHDEARTHLEAALALARRHRHPRIESAILDSLGYLAHRGGDHAGSLHRYREALTLSREIGDTYDEALYLEHLGDSWSALGDEQQAARAWQRVVELYRAQHRITDADRVQQLLTRLAAGSVTPAGDVSAVR